ncbi:MAG: DMT family transporter [Elusimicrobia bacterium]|nr:DMT family transporter [Elusimicrobiota bacterium]MDY6039863.1 DMT family transporter [Elusimicrobiaceae bacterium]
MKNSLFSPLAAAWICWAIVGASPVAGKYAVGVISPALLVFLGTLIGVFYFTPWITKNHKWGELFAPETRWKFLFIGTFGTALPFTISLIALHYTTPGNAAILQQSELFYSLLFAAIFLKEFPSKAQLAGSALIVAGVLVILLKEQYTPRWTGDLLIVGSTWMLQAGSTVAKKLPKHLDHRVISMARNLFALPALVIILAAMWLLKENFTLVPNVRMFSVLAYTGLLKYGLAMVVWYKAIRALDLSKVTAIYLSYPVLSLLISAGLGLETPTLYQIFGLAVTFAGAYWVSMTVKKEGH